MHIYIHRVLESCQISNKITKCQTKILQEITKMLFGHTPMVIKVSLWGILSLSSLLAVSVSVIKQYHVKLSWIYIYLSKIIEHTSNTSCSLICFVLQAPTTHRMFKSRLLHFPLVVSVGRRSFSKSDLGWSWRRMRYYDFSKVKISSFNP